MVVTTPKWPRSHCQGAPVGYLQSESAVEARLPWSLSQLPDA